MGWLRKMFGGQANWALKLTEIKSYVHFNNKSLYDVCEHILILDDYKINSNKITTDIETRLEAWRLQVVAACTAFTNSIPKADDDDFWLSLVIAIADEGNGSTLKKDDTVYIPYFERYNHTGYPILKPERGKGAYLVAEDLAAHFMKKAPTEVIELFCNRVVDYDRDVCHVVARLFGTEEKIAQSNMFSWFEEM